jgi:Phosphotransferase enzyme family
VTAVQDARTGDGFENAFLTEGELTEVTRRALGRDVRLTEVTRAVIDYDAGSPATAGLWRVDVAAEAEEEKLSCAYFVKLLRHARLWPGLSQIPDDGQRREFVEFFPWRFELDMYESGISRTLPGGMRSPILHHVKHVDPDHIALWWEFVSVRARPWRPGDYRHVAHLLGRLAARRRVGAEINRLLPAMSRDSAPGSSLRRYVEGRILKGILPRLRDDRVWGHPVMARALAHVEDLDLPADMLTLGARLPAILDLLDGLPQTYAHGDASPQNLLLPAAGADDVVVIDWGFGSPLAVGFDLGQLLVGLAHAGQVDTSDLSGIDTVILPAYLEGLAAEGLDVDPDIVRAGYIGSLVTRSALSALPLDWLGSAPSAGLDAVLVQRLRLTRFLVDMGAGLELPARVQRAIGAPSPHSEHRNRAIGAPTADSSSVSPPPGDRPRAL